MTELNSKWIEQIPMGWRREGEKTHHRVYRTATALRKRGSQVNHLEAKPARTPWNSVRKQSKNYNVVDSRAMATFEDLGLVWSWIPWHPTVTGSQSVGLGNIFLSTWGVYTAHQGKFHASEASRASCFSLQYEREEKVKHGLLLAFLLYGEQCQRTPEKLEGCFKWCLQITALRVPQKAV